MTYTNIYIARARVKYGRNTDAADTNVYEIKALFGLLYVAGVLKASHINLEHLWSDDAFAPELFRSVVSLKRFRFLLRMLRFDDITTRKERKESDKLAPIRELFEGFLEKCTMNYEVGAQCTIDEMLDGFRGRCSFRQYIPSKPAKYGIKIYSVEDSNNYYTANMEIYCGKQPENSPYQTDTPVA